MNLLPAEPFGRGEARRATATLAAFAGPHVLPSRQNAVAGVRDSVIQAVNPPAQPSLRPPARPAVGNSPQMMYRPPAARATAPGWWRRSYLFDWLAAVLIYVVFRIVHAVADFRQGYEVIPGDPDKSLPYHSDTIPGWANQLLCVVAPFVLAVLVQVGYSFYKQRKISVHDVHHTALALFTAYAMSQLVCHSLKVLIGAPRPNYFNNPHPESSGRSSFPSGHACQAWMGWTFFVLYLAGKFGTFHRHSAPVWLSLLTLAPLTIPVLVSVSRFLDYMHRWEDLIGGGLIGAFISRFFYSTFFEDLWWDESANPKSRPLGALPVTSPVQPNRRAVQQP